MIGNNGCTTSAKKTHFVGIAEMKVSESPTDILVAANLGSCLGIAVFDPIMKRAGLIHCLLPLSKSNPEKAVNEPCTFVDTGTLALLNWFMSRGSQQKHLIITVAGGSNINDENKAFEIGAKNYTIFKKVLWKNNLLLKAEDIGENCPRTISLDVETGEVLVKKLGATAKLV